jgi:uncharacterized protein YqhQ
MDDFKNLDSNSAKVKQKIKKLAIILGIVVAAIVGLVILVVVALFIYLGIAAMHGPLLLP